MKMAILVLKLSNPAQFHPWSDVDATVACLVITQSARDCEFSFLCSLTVRKKMVSFANSSSPSQLESLIQMIFVTCTGYSNYMVLFSNDTTCFPNLFVEKLLCRPCPAEEARMVANPVPPDTLMGCLCTWASSYAGTCLNYNRCTPTNSAFLMLEQWTSSLQRRSFFFLTDGVHKNGNSQPLADWAGLDDEARHHRVNVGPGTKLSQIRKFKGENDRFRSLGIKLSFGR